MVRFPSITVFLLDKTIVAFKNSTLLEVATACLKNPLADSDPLLIKINEDYKLYFNPTTFNAWIKKEIDLEELLTTVKVIGLYRNKEAIVLGNTSVEEGHLWLRKENLCILADDDHFVSTRVDERFMLFV